MSTFRLAAAVIAFGSLAGITAVAQTAAATRIGGHLRGERGDGIQRAAVVIFSRDGGIQRTTRTNSEGSFLFSGLPAGSYTLQGCAEGFGPTNAATVELTGSNEVTEDLRVGNRLENGVASCSIDVTDSPIPRRARDYDGDLMSLDMNGDIREILRSIALIGHLDVDTPASISRTVNVHLKNIPWDFALDAVLRTSGLASKTEGKTLRVHSADPTLGEDRVLMGTVMLAGTVASFSLQSPRSFLEINAPNSDGTMQSRSIEWESAEYLRDLGIAANAFKAGDRVIVTGSITRTSTLRLVSIRRSDGFSWGYLANARPSSFDGVMFVGLMSQ